VNDSWYRSPGWTEADQETFESRLKRARAWNRSQYLRIKGLALAEAGHREAALDLWQRGLECDVERFETPTLLEHMADVLQHHDPGRAEQLLRRLLVEQPDLNGTSTMAEVTLAEILSRARPRLASVRRTSY
jgi:lipopolysaccharide biosynthesis regulator YciM